MIRFVARRIATSAIAVFGVVTIIFVLARLVGDPVALMMQPGMTRADVAALRHGLGVDEPIPQQYFHFVIGALHGDFGISPWQSRPAFGLVMDRLPATLQLTVAALGFATVFGIALGTMAAARPGSWIVRLCDAISMTGQAMPNFWLALMLVLLLSTTLRWLPPAGYGHIENLIMPTLSLGLFAMSRLARLVQSELEAALRQDYVRTARAKGLSEPVVLLRHALANVAIPLVTVLAVDFGLLMGGAVVTESVFAWPGVGRLLIQAIGQRDFPILQAGAFVIATIVVMTSLIADLAYAVLDPKIRHA
ncbi:MAG: transporter permease [Rhodopila sp.]|nr:transporter permease [Rhodopila sp.]